MIHSLNIDKNVYLKDDYTPDDEVEKYFAATDIVVNPYIDATQSAIVQIAYGFEKTCVVTNVGGLPDVVDDMETGYVVEPFSPESIENAVCDYYLNNRETVFRRNIKAQQAKFSWERMVEEINTFFN